MSTKKIDAVAEILKTSDFACKRLNQFAARVLRTRGGRIGSGMGAVIESLWGFLLNRELAKESGNSIELAWMYGHEYNDFACIQKGSPWDPSTRVGELLRIEVKSMVASADESKAHFDRLAKELTETDLLAVFLWNWIPVNSEIGDQFTQYSPKIIDNFIGVASEVAKLRDVLHRERGGTFVESGQCPDGCQANECKHIGEPLNANGKRERLTGPLSAKVSATVSYAANFGGLVRMLKCNSPTARLEFRKICRESDTAWRFVSFIHRNLQSEEENQYGKDDWFKVADKIKLKELPTKKSELAAKIRSSITDYRDYLRSLD
jgi:hypothetical protein